MPTPSLSVSDLSFAWPDGSGVLDGLSFDLPAGVTGLVGANGSGKSTLLRLLAGELSPTRGSVSIAGTTGYLPQDLVLDADRTVEEHLGLAGVRRALAALDAGTASAEDLEAVGDDWDVEERAQAELARVGLPPGTLDRRLGELSGGEVVRLGLVRLLLARPDVLLLDEPTTNLDADAREHLLDTLAGWRGSALVVSHDRTLLDRVGHVADLHDGVLAWYGGNHAAYAEARAVEEAAVAQRVRNAAADVRRERRDLVRSEQELAKRRRFGQKMFENTREPRAVMRTRKRTAQESAAAYTATHQDRLAGARDRLAVAEDARREVDDVRVELPATEVPRARVVLETVDLVLRTGRAVDLRLDGPERVAVTGPNGSGKTTLLHTLAGLVAPASGTVRVRVPLRVLPQRFDLLDDDRSIADNLAGAAPSAGTNEVRRLLARFGFRGSEADRPASTLSGGERLRATFATLLLAEPAPQLLVLDEPTNSLDLASQRQLVTALEGYRGALLVASHDEPFLAEIGVDRRIAL